MKSASVGSGESFVFIAATSSASFASAAVFVIFDFLPIVNERREPVSSH
jgi:hypothetical protein